MKKSVFKIMLVSLMGVFFVSCSKNDNFDQSMQKAKEAIIERKFEQADGFVEMALESKPKDEEAKNYKKQIDSYNEALEFKEKKEIKNAIIKFDEVIEVNKGSEKLIEYAKKEKIDLEKQKDSPEKSTKKNENKKKEAKTIWNTSKADSLRQFMSQFSQTMDQSYKEYNQTTNVDLYGVQLPGDVLDGEWTMAVNEQPVKIEWSETGDGKTQYQLVAVYSDAETQPAMQQHVYFFVLDGGNPKVLVTQQNQGNDKNYLYFNQSQNEELNNGFNQIVSNKEVAKPTNTEQASKMTFEEAVDYVVSSSDKWYDLSAEDEDNLEIVSINKDLSEIRSDSKGDYYTVVLNTNKTPQGVLQSGAQFKVYLDGSIEQRSMGAGRDEWLELAK